MNIPYKLISASVFLSVMCCLSSDQVLGKDAYKNPVYTSKSNDCRNKVYKRGK